jgi:hypothetical protein
VGGGHGGGGESGLKWAGLLFFFFLFFHSAPDVAAAFLDERIDFTFFLSPRLQVTRDLPVPLIPGQLFLLPSKRRRKEISFIPATPRGQTPRRIKRRKRKRRRVGWATLMNKIDGSILMVLISPDRRWAGPRKTKGARYFPPF